jgi:hypothetical protein
MTIAQERRVAELRHAVAESITCPPDPDDGRISNVTPDTD